MRISDDCRDSGFTLVEIMIVVAIIAILAAIVIPQLIESRKMANLNKCMNLLKVVDYAYEQYALNQDMASGVALTTAQWDEALAFVRDTVLCPNGGEIRQTSVGGYCYCTYHGSISAPYALSALSSG